jgi:hypothetical protein
VLDFFVVGGGSLADTSTRSMVEVDGLTGLVAIRGELFDRPEADGGVNPSAQYQSARVVSGIGEVWGASEAAVWTDWQSLAGTLEVAMNTDTLLQWREAGGSVTKRGYCRVIGDLLPTLAADEQGPFLRYQIQLRLSDPRWYAETEQTDTVGSPTVDGGMPLPVIFPIPFGEGSTGGALTATNGGNTKTWPTIEIQGPINGPVVENVTLGYALYFPTLVVGVGEVLTITTNPSGRGAEVDSSNVLGDLDYQSSRWFWLAQGANSIRFYGISGGYDSGTGMTVRWRDAYNA